MAEKIDAPWDQATAMDENVVTEGIKLSIFSENPITEGIQPDAGGSLPPAAYLKSAAEFSAVFKKTEYTELKCKDGEFPTLLSGKCDGFFGDDTTDAGQHGVADSWQMYVFQLQCDQID